jgi:hypothetical protein
VSLWFEVDAAKPQFTPSDAKNERKSRLAVRPTAR